MPWVPELFSWPALERLEEKWQRETLEAVPYFDGLMAREHDALVNSFTGEPELHDPVRGRVKGVRAFETFIAETNASLAQRNVSVEDVHYVITERRGFEEVVLHFDGETGRVELPVAIVADHHSRVPASALGRRRRRDRGDIGTGRLRPRVCGRPVHTPRPRRACAPSTSGCSRTTAASHWNTAHWSMTGRRARWSTTS
jgi:hypothetical protein